MPMLFAGDDAAGAGGAFCALPNTARAIRVGSTEALFIGFSLSSGLALKAIYALCLDAHSAAGYWQKRQFTTKHADERSDRAATDQRRLSRHHWPV
jgi:hypothetical protein